MTAIRTWTPPICIIGGVALLLPLVASAGPEALGDVIFGGAGLVWFVPRRCSADRR